MVRHPVGSESGVRHSPKAHARDGCRARRTLLHRGAAVALREDPRLEGAVQGGCASCSSPSRVLRTPPGGSRRGHGGRLTSSRGGGVAPATPRQVARVMHDSSRLVSAMRARSRVPWASAHIRSMSAGLWDATQMSITVRAAAVDPAVLHRTMQDVRSFVGPVHTSQRTARQHAHAKRHRQPNHP